MSKYLSPKLARQFNPTELALPGARAGSIRLSFLVCYCRDEDVETTSALIVKAMKVIAAAKGTCGNILSSIIVAWFDLDEEPLAEKQVEDTAKRIQQVLSSDAKAVYGTCIAQYGEFGTAFRIDNRPFIKGMGQVFEAVSKLHFGKIQRLPEIF